MPSIEEVILERVLQGHNPFFVKWAEEATQKAAEKAKAEGWAESLRQNITDLLERSPLTEQQIAEIFQVPLALVNEIREDLRNQGRTAQMG